MYTFMPILYRIHVRAACISAVVKCGTGPVTPRAPRVAVARTWLVARGCGRGPGDGADGAPSSGSAGRGAGNASLDQGFYN